MKERQGPVLGAPPGTSSHPTWAGQSRIALEHPRALGLYGFNFNNNKNNPRSQGEC